MVKAQADQDLAALMMVQDHWAELDIVNIMEADVIANILTIVETRIRMTNVSSYREKTRFRADYSKQPSSSEFRIQSFSEKINARKKYHLSERKYYYKRHKSRSPSSEWLKTSSTGPEPVRHEKPGGKQKYKTWHMEGTHEMAHPSCKFASKVKECDYQRSLPKLDGNHRNESDSFSDSQSSDRQITRGKKKGPGA